jgi:WXXGXW repeat (2 copies)
MSVSFKMRRRHRKALWRSLHFMNTLISQALRTRAALLRIAGGLGLLAIAGFLASPLVAFPILADITLKIGPGIDEPPPPPRHEVVDELCRPRPDFVWVEGYWDGAPGRYSWIGGHWERPPHPSDHWIAPRWEKDRDGHYHLIKGEWRRGDRNG